MYTNKLFSEKLKLELPYNPPISVLGMCPAYNRDTCTLMFIVELFRIDKL
jgi:hypothetical protein